MRLRVTRLCSCWQLKGALQPGTCCPASVRLRRPLVPRYLASMHFAASNAGTRYSYCTCTSTTDSGYKVTNGPRVQLDSSTSTSTSTSPARSCLEFKHASCLRRTDHVKSPSFIYRRTIIHSPDLMVRRVSQVDSFWGPRLYL